MKGMNRGNGFGHYFCRIRTSPMPPFTLRFTLDEIGTAAATFWQQAARYPVITFSGDLGAGKTTFISALCRVQGVEDTVSSPTYSIINEYRFTDEAGQPHTIYHMDWYRLNSVEEAINAGVEDSLYRPNAWCFVEWAERAPELLGERLAVTITVAADGSRELTARAVPA